MKPCNEDEAEELRREIYRLIRDDTLVPWIKRQRHSCNDSHTNEACPVGIAVLACFAQFCVAQSVGAIGMNETEFLEYMRGVFQIMEKDVVARRQRAGVALPTRRSDVN